MSRLTIQLDGRPAHLYEFVQGAYEDKRVFICAHTEELTDEQAIDRLRAKMLELPEEISFDDKLDLFERVLELAGFVPLEGPWIPISRASTPAKEREWLEEALAHAAREAKKRRRDATKTEKTRP